MAGYQRINSPELSQKQDEHAEWSMSQYLLGALALFGAARYLPKMVARMPGIREHISEGLVNLATKVTPEAAENFFEGLGTYAGRRSAIFSNMGWRQRLQTLPNEITNLRQSFTDAAAGSTLRDRQRYFMEDAIHNFNFTEKGIRKVNAPAPVVNQVFRTWHEALLKESERRTKSSSLTDLVNLKHLSIAEALVRPKDLKLSDSTLQEFQDFQHFIGINYGKEAVEKFGQLPLDHRLYVNHSAQLVDFRGLMQAYNHVTNTLATDWQVPFVKINPFTIMGFNQFKTLQNESFSRVFPIFSRGPALYHLERGRPEIGDSSGVLSFVGGKMLEVTQSGKLHIDEGWHVTTPGSQFGQHVRRMLGFKVQDYAEKIPGSRWAAFAKRWDLFRQEMEHEDFEIFSVDSWSSSLINKAIDRTSPFKKTMDWADVHDQIPQWADPRFGQDAHLREYRVAFRQSKIGLNNLDPQQLWKEIAASPRRDPENVTTATMIGYTFAYKLNVAMTQIGLGLSTESMGSTVDFFKNLMTKRVLPMMGLFYAWRGVNEVTDSASPASAAAAGVKGWQNVVSGLSDVMGLPDRFKRLGELMPGFDQLADFPVLPLPNNHGEISVLTVGDLLPVNLTRQELDDDRQYGMTPIRRARYWSVGNSPYTGSDIIGYMPQWSRMTNPAAAYNYGPGARRGNSLAPFTDVPLVGGALGGIASGGLHSREPKRGNTGFYLIDGPMGTFRIHGGAPGGAGDGLGGSGTGGGTGGGGTGGTPGAEIRGPIGSIVRTPDEPGNILERMGGAAGRQVSDIMGFTGFAIRTATGLDPKRNVGIWASGGIGNTLWHSQLGGFGGTISEVLRRFFPPEQVDDSGDTTPSGMPSWMPGASAFTDFQHGYAYEKVPMGHYTLPGPLFAGMNKLPGMDLSLEAGLLGGSPESLNAWWTYSDPNRGGVDKAAAKSLMEELKAEGQFTVKQGGRVVNEGNQVFTDVPFFIQQADQPVPAFVAGAEEGPDGPTYRRAQFAAAQLGVVQSLVFTQDKAGVKATPVQPDVAAVAQMMGQVADQRAHVQRAIADGRMNGMEFYHPAYRLLSLAADSPTSDEYRATSKLVTSLKLTPELDRVVKQARSIASDNKQKLRIYPYKFLHQELKTISGEVSQVIDKNHILVDGVANPIRLAGIHVLPAEPGAQAEEYLRATLQPGTNVSFEIGANEAWKLGKEGQTLPAIVRVHGKNINQELLNQGLAEENMKDDSPAGLQMRYSPAQRLFGAVWEGFAHLPLITHTKFLQVKSPVEAYMDREIFGKSFQSWSNPVSDFLVPTMQSFGRLGPLVATMAGATIGYRFGVKPEGRIFFSLLGALAGATTSAVIGAKQLIAGQTWTPDRRKKQWHLEEYMDALKYVKAMHNFSGLAAQAQSEEGFDAGAYLNTIDQKSQNNRSTKNLLLAKKRKARLAGKDASAQSLAAEMQIPGEYATTDDLLKEINRMIAGISEDRGVQQIGPIAAQALSWYKESKQTMQGWTPGDSIADLIVALPAIDRKYFPQLLESSPEELQKLGQVAPSYLMRALHQARGEGADGARSLSDIFAESGLPGPNWEGWRPEVSLGDARIKIIRREAMDIHGMGVYPQDLEKAARSGITNVPKVFDYQQHPAAGDIETRIRSVLGSGGIDFNIDVVAGGDGLKVQIDHQHDRRGLIQQMLMAGGLFGK